ncbi:MAG: hypothetical protein KF785_16835, partial [Gemmatimonadales bacterium]|nr:hypothetical protein [Gemmatimonadales bacterium]
NSGKPYFFERLLGSREDFGEAVARIIVYGDEEPRGQDPAGVSDPRPEPGSVSYVVHSLGSPTVSAMVREVLDEDAVPRLAAWLGGPDAALRAELVFACFAGVHAMRQIVGTAELSRAGAERLTAALAPMLQACADGGSTPPPASVMKRPRNA